MKRLNVGLIGCGSFAKAIHVPNLLKNPKYRILATADLNEEAAVELATETGAAYSTSDPERVFSDPEIDVVFITTRHDSHAGLTIRAAEAGKHILCEKPMALNREEVQAIVAAVRKAGVKYTVGYNRGMAPLVTKARELLAALPDKRMVYHRIQAHFSATHWTHDPAVGGGRFVGEGCHIFDLLCELAPAPPVMVYASGGTFLDPEVVKIPDSAIVTITFADGSVGTTLIASAGCGTFPKEVTEIYCALRAVYIHDFREMEYHGFEGQERVKVELSATDKGQPVEIEALAEAILNDTESPNGLTQAARAAVISYMVNESVASGQPLPISESDYVF